MTNILLQLEYGGYISLVKLIIYLAVFIAWIPLFVWVHKDSHEVRTNTEFWTGIVFGAPAVSFVLCLFIPFFIIGILLSITAIISSAIIYVMHRNTLVAEFEKVLTTEHIKSLFSNTGKKAAKANKGIVFVTANKNEVELPTYKTPEFFGYQLAQELMDDAIWRRAEDITMLPMAEGYDVFYRIDGLQVKQESRNKEDMEYLTRFLKHLGDLDINEKRKPQTSRFTTKKEKIQTEFQIITAGSTAGEKIVIIRMQEGSLKSLEEIGLTKGQIESFTKLREEGKGVFLVTGPAATGVSTTLYALIKKTDPFLNNINILEKKKSLELHNVTQNYYKLGDTGTTTYARRLQTMLRTGPDIVAVGDIDDADTAKVLTTFATSDPKLIYATLSAPSVMQALAKWFKMVPDRNLAIDILTGISCQRLVRKLCQECKQAYEPNIEIFKKFNIPADKIKILYRQGQIEYDKHGKPIVCQNCQGTGFVGRIGVFETIIFTPELKEAVKQAKSLQEISTYFRKARMLFLQEQAIRKVAEGITSIDEIIREFSPKADSSTKKNDANKE